jgi:hypothetical protein
LDAFCPPPPHGPVGHPHDAGLAVQLEEDPNLAVLVRLADRLAADYQHLAAFQFDRNLLACGQPVEIDGGGQDFRRPIALLGGAKSQNTLGYIR